MAKKKINAQDLIRKIEKITKARMASEDVVQLDNFRDLKQKLDQKTILVIEDDETMRNAMKRIFELDGFIVKLAADGTELSSVLDDSSPDLILLDIGLPWLNGFELIRRLPVDTWPAQRSPSLSDMEGGCGSSPMAVRRTTSTSNPWSLTAVCF